MKNNVKIFLFLLVLAVGIYCLRPWETSNQLSSDDHQSSVVTPNKKGGSRLPASIGNPGEASARSIRE